MLDTSVAVRLLTAAHARHEAVAAWASGRELVIGGHAALETYSVLTRLPGDSRVAPADAIALLDENFGDPLVLEEDRAVDVHRELARHAVTGGAVYDGLVALAARRHAAILATRDARARSTYEALGVRIEVLADT